MVDCYRARQYTEPTLFQATAWYYARYRPNYPAGIFDFLMDGFDLDKPKILLDLGCGTGQIAIPMAARRVQVYAVDPEVEMLAEGLKAEQRAGVLGIAWLRGDDERIDKINLPPVSICTMGSSFHWMNQDKVLRLLDRIVVPEGGIAILSGGSSIWSDSEKGWSRVVKEVVIDLLGPERRAGTGTYDHPIDDHQVILSRSPFQHVERYELISPQSLTVDEIVGLQLSTSYASPVQLGSKMEEFCRMLKDRLLNLEPSGAFENELRFEVLRATR